MTRLLSWFFQCTTSLGKAQLCKHNLHIGKPVPLQKLTTVRVLRLPETNTPASPGLGAHKICGQNGPIDSSREKSVGTTVSPTRGSKA